MTSEAAAVYLLLGILLPVLIAQWARAWGRNPIAWGLIAFLLTPFFFLVVAAALALRGKRRADRPDRMAG